MSRLTDLEAALDNMAARLKDITASPKPTYTIDGQNVAWVQYHRMLLEGMTQLRAEIEKEDDPFYSEETQGYVEPHWGV